MADDYRSISRCANWPCLQAMWSRYVRNGCRKALGDHSAGGCDASMRAVRLFGRRNRDACRGQGWCRTCRVMRDIVVTMPAFVCSGHEHHAPKLIETGLKASHANGCSWPQTTSRRVYGATNWKRLRPERLPKLGLLNAVSRRSA